MIYIIIKNATDVKAALSGLRFCYDKIKRKSYSLTLFGRMAEN